MARLPRTSGLKAVAALKKLGFEEQRTRGSHVILRDAGGRRAVIPVHGTHTLKPATLASVLREADVDLEDFIAAL